MMLVITSVAVALVVFIIYALERRSRDKPIDWIDASKLSLFGGLLTSGVVFATTSDVSVVNDVTEVVKNIIEQNMPERIARWKNEAV
jgi:uncharacterized membrane protein YdcZ (DUF606 family)